jgi:hypothetical protein
MRLQIYLCALIYANMEPQEEEAVEPSNDPKAGPYASLCFTSA